MSYLTGLEITTFSQECVRVYLTNVKPEKLKGQKGSGGLGKHTTAKLLKHQIGSEKGQLRMCHIKNRTQSEPFPGNTHSYLLALGERHTVTASGSEGSHPCKPTCWNLTPNAMVLWCGVYKEMGLVSFRYCSKTPETMISQRKQACLGSSPRSGTHAFGIWQGQYGMMGVSDRPKMFVLWTRKQITKGRKRLAFHNAIQWYYPNDLRTSHEVSLHKTPPWGPRMQHLAFIHVKAEVRRGGTLRKVDQANLYSLSTTRGHIESVLTRLQICSHLELLKKILMFIRNRICGDFVRAANTKMCFFLWEVYPPSPIFLSLLIFGSQHGTYPWTHDLPPWMQS